MRLLLISDTHGQLGVVNRLAAATNADAVVHAGDFGFYGGDSYERLSEREIRLLLAHSDLTQEQKNRALALPAGEQVTVAHDHELVGEFQLYMDGTAAFRVPVYAVWGNHEDRQVVDSLYRGDLSIPNLHLLHEESCFELEGVFLYGLGGNLLPGSKMLHKPIAGGGGRIWSTLSQYADLTRMIDARRASGLRVFVSHVSPGKERFIELMGARTGARFTVSGHMAAPASIVWSAFAVHSVEEAEARIQAGLEAVKTACLQSRASSESAIKEAVELIGRLPQDAEHIGRGVKAPRWYRSMTHVNLPDACVGYSLLDVDGDVGRLQSFIADVPL